MLIWADRRFRLGHGRVFWLYVAGYTLGRFFIEFMRRDEANLILGLRVNTWVSAILFITAVVIFLMLRKGRETPEEVDPEYNRSSTAGSGDRGYRVAVNDAQETDEGEVGTRG